MLLGPTTYTDPGRVDVVVAEHRIIIEALKARDPDAAWAALGHIAGLLRPGPQWSAAAREALAVAQTLPGAERHPTRNRLARLAQ